MKNNLPQPLTDQDLRLAQYAKALGHPARIFMLRFLDQQTACFAGDLSDQLPMARSTVSQHLTALKEAGLIQGTITPPTIRYCINRANWEEARSLFQDFLNL